MSVDPLRNDARTARRRRELGAHPFCLFCGVADQAVLQADQGHHILGRDTAPDATVIVCRNCHARAHADLRDAGVRLGPPAAQRPALEQIVDALRALAVLFGQLAETVTAWADLLERLLGGLDVAFPAWRTLPEARP